MADFFERKKVAKPDSFSDFDLTQESDLGSCGLDEQGKNFAARNNSFFDSLQMRLKALSEKHKKTGNCDNPTGTTAKLLEDHFLSREISYLLSRTILDESLREINKAKNNSKNN